MEKLKVLVVEDVKSVQKIWDKILLDEVFEKSFAGDGKEGLEMYQSSRPDIILLDIQMPEMTGYSVLKEIRKSMGDMSTAIVMQTTVSQKDDIMECVKLGIQGYIIKPFDEEIVGAFDGCIMHLHSTGYVPVEHYLEMNFAAIELHIDNGGLSAEELFDTHRMILDRKPLIIGGDIPQRDLDWIFSKLPPRGLAVMTVVESPEQAETIWRKYAAKH